MDRPVDGFSLARRFLNPLFRSPGDRLQAILRIHGLSTGQVTRPTAGTAWKRAQAARLLIGRGRIRERQGSRLQYILLLVHRPKSAMAMQPPRQTYCTSMSSHW
ncbi:hypothetical protein N7474_008184 [Penicillium riverlandense]|uniref:uncharacterized protein n=1 Tax=Penicillium riverlandense TaxID=1903569 RepID=UPI00254959B4|nr:uncharacterized protein N7474_008184 [Penicillium riverlandense]KAJ5811883.1 hypothetical protein N7474_008184 [Penicillium riverlandense]